MKLTSLLVSSPLFALVALTAGLPALPVFACATAGLLLALMVEHYQAPQHVGALRRASVRAPRSRRTRLPLAA